LRRPCNVIHSFFLQIPVALSERENDCRVGEESESFERRKEADLRVINPVERDAMNEYLSGVFNSRTLVAQYREYTELV
jgi:hypothetical protein